MARTWPVVLLVLAMAALALMLPRETARAQMLAFSSPVDAAGRPARVQRVQADLARNVESWIGDRDCRAPARARAALKPVLARWLGGRMTDRPHQRLARWGYHSGDIWHEVQIVEGRHVCRAGFRRIVAFADFR